MELRPNGLHDMGRVEVEGGAILIRWSQQPRESGPAEAVPWVPVKGEPFLVCDSAETAIWAFALLSRDNGTPEETIESLRAERDRLQSVEHLRDIRFKSVPVEVAQILQEQVSAAMQLVAALILTDAEVRCYQQKKDPELRPENLGNWATSVKEELLSAEWKEKLVEVIYRHGFFTNTHPGFPIGALDDGIPPVYLLSDAFKDLEALLQAYANGEDETAPVVENRDAQRANYKDFWIARLAKKGHEKMVSEWCMDHVGYLLALQASMERMMRPVRARKAAKGVKL